MGWVKIASSLPKLSPSSVYFFSFSRGPGFLVAHRGVSRFVVVFWRLRFSGFGGTVAFESHQGVLLLKVGAAGRL